MAGVAPDRPRAERTRLAMLRDRIETMRATATSPVLVALDGRSGSGKSTLARQLVAEVDDALVIDGDDFYCGGDDGFWGARSPEEKVDLIIDWRCQRVLLEQLGHGEPATWHPCDWQADDGRLGPAIIAGPCRGRHPPWCLQRPP